MPDGRPRNSTAAAGAWGCSGVGGRPATCSVTCVRPWSSRSAWRTSSRWYAGAPSWRRSTDASSESACNRTWRYRKCGNRDRHIQCRPSCVRPWSGCCGQRFWTRSCCPRRCRCAGPPWRHRMRTGTCKRTWLQQVRQQAQQFRTARSLVKNWFELASRVRDWCVAAVQLQLPGPRAPGAISAAKRRICLLWRYRYAADVRQPTARPLACPSEIFNPIPSRRPVYPKLVLRIRIMVYIGIQHTSVRCIHTQKYVLLLFALQREISINKSFFFFFRFCNSASCAIWLDCGQASVRMFIRWNKKQPRRN